MTSSHAHLSHGQRQSLVDTLQAQLAILQQDNAARLENMTQTEHAQHVLIQEAEDESQHAGEHEVEASMSDINNHELNAITSALVRINTPDYGVCIDCLATIPFERLKVEPQALRCITCETKYEENIT